MVKYVITELNLAIITQCVSAYYAEMAGLPPIGLVPELRKRET